MEIREITTLDMLTKHSVSVLRQKFIEVDGVPQQVGENWRIAYVNTPQDRALMQEALSPEYYKAVISVWGNAPANGEENGN